MDTLYNHTFGSASRWRFLTSAHLPEYQQHLPASGLALPCSRGTLQLPRTPYICVAKTASLQDEGGPKFIIITVTTCGLHLMWNKWENWILRDGLGLDTSPRRSGSQFQRARKKCRGDARLHLFDKRLQQPARLQSRRPMSGKF